MKLCNLRFKNLNSLAGEWAIDFSAEDYAATGIFAITGPTGAGKSTILDALCLALYGRTPRLSVISTSTNEIMSRQTGDCFAEATIETREGRFRCHWGQHRAYGRPDGNLSPARHEIADAVTGKVLEEKKSAVPKVVEEKTGMNYDRFTRSVLLAQGGFAAFLQASPGQRAPILEQITGTEIYSAISMHVHERRRKEQAALEALEAEARGIRFLSDDEEAGLNRELSDCQAREQRLAGQAAEVASSIAWLGTLASLEAELRALEKAQEDLARQQEAFEPDRKRLERSRLAAGLGSAHVLLDSLRQQQTRDQGGLGGAEALVPERELFLKARETDLKRALEDRDEIRKTARQQGDLIRTVRELDLRIQEQDRQAVVVSSDITLLETRISDLGVQQSLLDRAGQDLARDLETTGKYLEENAGDQDLVPEFSRIRATLRELDMIRRNRADIQVSLGTLNQQKEVASRDLDARQKACRQSRDGLEKALTAEAGLRDELVALLGKTELPVWRQRQDRLRQDFQVLEAITGHLAAIDEGEARLAREGQTGLKLQKSRDTLLETLAALSKQQALQGREKEHLETEVALRRTIRDFQEERRKLADGLPCPLCGSMDHPYARGNTPELTRVEKELETARKGWDRTCEALAAAQVKQAALEADLVHAREREKECSAGLENVRQALASRVRDLAVPDGFQVSGDSVQEAMRTAKEQAGAVAAIVHQAETMETTLARLAGDVSLAREALGGAEKSLEKARLHVLEKTAECRQADRDFQRLTLDSSRLETGLADALKGHGVRELPASGLDALADLLETRVRTWQERTHAFRDLEKRADKLAADRKALEALSGTHAESLAEKKQVLAGMLARVNDLKRQRRELYGEKDPDKEEQHLRDRTARAETTAVEAGQAVDRAGFQVRQLLDRIAGLTQGIRERSVILEQKEAGFRELLTASGFDTEAEFLASCLEPDLQASLAARAKALDAQGADLASRQARCRSTLEHERARAVTGQSGDELEILQKEISEAVKAVGQAMGGIKQRLSDNAAARASHGELLLSINRQKDETRQWDLLHELIGSADGNKYRTFAQGLTFEIMVSHANRQLVKMTDRYLLVRDDALPLELNVADNYQAGEIRSTKNLSGGESFIVSLALALGLSHMASRQVRVDSLFLDEGFGTLDEEALEIALDTLAGLNRDGKVIGVISHVPALKERISARISVEPGSGGKSVLSGPGCRRISR